VEKIVAFIPVRGGSKSIPLKNIKLINGRPLVYWTAFAASTCPFIDEVFVATDDKNIASVVNEFGLDKVKVIGRSAFSASDIASTESAMLEFAEQHHFEHIVLIQATSPMLEADDLTKGIELYQQENVDSVLSVVRQKRFVWKEHSGYVEPLNYDLYHRPRRQEFEGYLVENGAFYITSKKLLMKTQNRISGKIKAVEMKEESYFEIDEPSDWVVIENLMKNKIQKANQQTPIKMLLTDCDGVLTDGGMYYTENGDEIKKFNTRDGMAFEILRKRGILTGIISGEDRKIVRDRANKLKVNECHVGIKDKIEVIKGIAKKYNLHLDEIAYIGDDINDLECMKACGFSACPCDAVQEVRQTAKYICSASGGNGVIREIADLFINHMVH
jgi:N-acylneuraminate cytidylyltransferase